MQGKPPLTVPGRILAIAAFTLAVGGTAAFIELTSDDLAPGDYPIVLFAVPAVAGAIIFFGVGAAILNKFGFAIFNSQDDEDRPAEQPD